jgi:hypothetical protein
VANLLLPYDLTTPGSDITTLRITADFVRGQGEPIIERSKEAAGQVQVREA